MPFSDAPYIIVRSTINVKERGCAAYGCEMPGHPRRKEQERREKKEERERRKMVNASLDLASEAAVPML